MKYQCQICGYIHDEEKEGKSFKELEKCPDCKSDVSNFEIMKKDEKARQAADWCKNNYGIEL